MDLATAVSTAAGPTAWRNWQGHLWARTPRHSGNGHRQGYRSGNGALRLTESALYTDAELHGDQVTAGPFTFINTLANVGSGVPGAAFAWGAGPGLILRTQWYLEWDVDATVDQTDDSRYVGGSSEDEMAALMSLATGRRFRAGGVVREWRRDGDPFGRPVEYDRQPQAPIPPRRRPVLPSLGDAVNIEDAAKLLARYGELEPDVAVRLARAARLYANGLWVADSDPNTTWLWLVSAIETATTTGNRGDGAGRRYRRFLAAHAPGPPKVRAPWTTVDWDHLPDLLSTIYDARSRALHNGRPFPVPMLEPPRFETNEGNEPDGNPQSAGYIERADGIATFAHDAIWASSDIPMLLWVFEYIVRSSLLNWWASLLDS